MGGFSQARRYGNKNAFVSLGYRLLMTTCLVTTCCLRQRNTNDEGIYNVMKLRDKLACHLKHPGRHTKLAFIKLPA